MSNPDVSEELKKELVEIAAKRLYQQGASQRVWEMLDAQWQEEYRDDGLAIVEAIAPRLKAEGLREGMKEAAIAWTVCASIHREYAKGRDPLFKTRQADFVKAADKARADALSPQAKETK